VRAVQQTVRQRQVARHVLCPTKELITLHLETTLKRHRYYCRSRKAVQNPRSRSCLICARAKVRCDNRRPECSRCSNKTIQCQYSEKIPRYPPQTVNQDNYAPIQHHEAVLSSFLDQSSSIPDTVVDVSDLALPTSPAGWFDSDDFSALDKSDEIVTPYSLGDQLPYSLFALSDSIQPMPTQTVRSFSRRPRLNPTTRRTANLIFHALKSYTLMISRDKNLPPFIHPHFTSSDTATGEIESLTNSIILTQLLSNGGQGSRKLFWKNVRSECERFHAEVCHAQHVCPISAKYRNLASTNEQGRVIGCPASPLHLHPH
jgi:Fungal Zn(2)-Cys(6) binuclear cluster domain